MNKKSKKKIQANYFANGDFLNKGMPIISGATDLLASGIGNLQKQEFASTNFNAGSTNSLLAAAQSYNKPKANETNLLATSAKGLASGAAAGAAFGPIGAAIGGAVGIASNLFTGIRGNNRNEQLAQEAYQRDMGSIAQNASALNQESTQNALMNYYGQGGNLFANGGFTNGMNEFEGGGTHEANPLGGIPQGMGQNGLPNLVEDGEVKFRDYIFSNRLKANEEQLTAIGLPNKYKDKTFGDIAKKLQKESKERPNDPISKRGLADMMDRLRTVQESVKPPEQAQANQFPNGGGLFVTPRPQDPVGPWNNWGATPTTQTPIQTPVTTAPVAPATTTKSSTKKASTVPPGNVPPMDLSFNNNPLRQAGLKTDAVVTPNPQMLTSATKEQVMNKAQQDYQSNQNNQQGFNPAYLRYAPVVASGIQAFTDMAGLTNKPNYDLANSIANQQVRAPRITERLNYKPMDQQYNLNQLDAQQAAARSGIANQAGGNRAAAMAGIMGADYAGGLQRGALARQAQESNQNQMERVAGFNRQTSQMNAESDRWEQSTKMQNNINAAQARQQENMMSSQVRSSNINNFLENIGGVGQETMNLEMIKNNPQWLYYMTALGKTKYKQQ